MVPGTLAPYIVSYYHSFDSSISLSDVIIISMIAYFTQTTNLIILSHLVKKYSELWLILIGLLVGTISMFFSSFITTPSLFFYTFGVIIGTIGCYLCHGPIWLGWKELPGSMKGLATGLGLSGYSLSPFIYGFTFTLIINPNNESTTQTEEDGDFKEKLFSKEVYQNFPSTIRYISIILFLVGLFGLCLMFRKIEKKEKEPPVASIPMLKNLKTLKFWYVCGFGFTKMFVFFFMVNIYKTLGLLYVNDDYFLSYVSTIAFILGAIGRVFFGKLLDVYPWKTLNIVLGFVELFLMLVFYYVLEYRYLFALLTILALIVSGGSYISVWFLTEKAFHNQKGVFPMVSYSFVILFVFIFVFIRNIIPVKNI